ncbi:MAG TPA: polyprenol monophosphomannose synthase [Ardenticatenaceae bacterium]|nr:polyprenol monophosphomannose synthase [Ardenticatenaceae bacterium]
MPALSPLRPAGPVRSLDRAHTFVVVPTYNEADNVPPLVEALFALPVANLHVVVVDDNSLDGTGRIADELRPEYPRLHVIHRVDKRGLGSAYRDGFRFALQQGADFVVQMDADFSHSPDYIPTFLEQMQTNDVVVGSRYATGGCLDPQWSASRHLLSWWANAIYTRVILGLSVCDTTAGFKCWSRRALQAILAQGVRSCGYVFQVEMAYLAEKLGFRVAEVPIYFEERRAGSSKMSLAIKLEAAWRTLLLRWEHRHTGRMVTPRPVRRMQRIAVPAVQLSAARAHAVHRSTTGVRNDRA